MKILGRVFGILTIVCLCGCATNVTQLRQERDTLNAEVAAKNGQIKTLETRQQYLENELASHKRIGQTLRQEKKVRVEDVAGMRREVRAYIKEQMQHLRKFSEHERLLDYVGGELIPRANSSGNNLLLVDMQNPIPIAGTLLGAKVIANSKTELSVCIVRPQGENLVLMWVSKPYAVPKPGPTSMTFDTLVAVEKGDFIGLYSPTTLQVPYSTGTGDSRTLSGPIHVGKIIPVKSFNKSQQRMYSFGVTGFLK